MVGMPVKMKIEDGKEGIRGDLNLRLKMGRSVSVEILTYNRRMFDIEYYHFAQILSIFLESRGSRRHSLYLIQYAPQASQSQGQAMCVAGITESVKGFYTHRSYRYRVERGGFVFVLGV